MTPTPQKSSLMKLNRIAAAAACALLATSGFALDAQDLGGALTPAGAEKAGNADGSIPAYAGPVAAPAGWSFGKPRGDYFAHKDDKSLASIDASNADKYAAQLSPGQLALLKGLKGYRMDVFPTRRTCAQPDFVSQATRKNAAGAASMAADGWSVKQALLPGVPFPVPKSGVEVLWNFKLRYRGVGTEYTNGVTAVSPRPGASEWIEASWQQLQYFPWGSSRATGQPQPLTIEAQQMFSYKTPAALAGQGLVATGYTSDRETEVFYYFPGQRRVRRMPSYSYDAPQIGFENQYTIDQSSMFTGPPDRYDWKLAGKREMLVPYNNFALYSRIANLHDVAQPEFVNADKRRYEKHRVWVVEGTLKPGLRHASPKRVFYFDEDSWIMLLAEDYDAQNKLWKFRESYPIPVYETGSCDFYPFAQYDLIAGRYLADMLPVKSEIKWFVESDEARFKQSYYTADNLRALSER